jgi:hypothetical protein
MPLNPVPNYPASLDSLPDPTSATYVDDDGFELDLLLSKHNAIMEALEAKLGTGASVPDANEVLVGNGAGASTWLAGLTADYIAANAVSQVGSANGSSFGPTTTSASYVDLTDMSVTLTGVTVGSKLVAIFSGTFQHNTVTAGVKTAFSLDGAAEVGGSTFVAAATNQQSPLVLVRVFTATATSHTIKTRWFASTPTATAVGTDRTLIVVELKR